METSNLIFIVGRQRSGTTVFRELLAKHGALDCDEIFHGDLNVPRRFYAYLQKRIQSQPELIYPMRHEEVFQDYIKELSEQNPHAKIVMDVKYFALNLIPGHEDMDVSLPFIIRFMQWSNAHVVHIVRRNKLRVHVSEEISVATGKWSAQSLDQLVKDKPRIKFDINKLLEVIKKLEHQDAIATRQLASLKHYSTIEYERMFDQEGNFAPETTRIAAQCLDRTTVSNVPVNLRMNPESLPQLIENYNEVASALSHTPYQWMLECTS